MADLRVRVLAVADASLRSAFKPLEEAADAAQKKVRGLGKGVGGPEAKAAHRESLAIAREKIRAHRAIAAESARQDARERASAAQASARDGKESVKRVERQARDELRIKEKAHRDEVKLFDQKFRARQAERKAEEKEILKTAAAGHRADARQAKTDQRATTNRWVDMGGSVTRSLSGLARGGISQAGQAARGAGVDWSTASVVQRNVDVEKTTAKATLAGMAAKGKVATPEDVKASLDTVHAAGNKTGASFGDMAGALDAFVAKSGDLATGKAMIADIGTIAQATGANITELADAAGAISNNMGDVPNKAAKVKAALASMAVMSTRGSVEVKDLAKYAPRLAAGANAFGGDYSKNLSQLNVIAQMAQKGGRSTAAEATITAANWGRDLTKNSTKGLEDAGIDVFTDDKKTSLRDSKDLIKEMLVASQGDKTKLQKMLPNQTSRAVLESFIPEMTTATAGMKSGKAKDEAIRNFIDKKFAELEQKADPAMLDKMAETYRGTNAGKAGKAQNRIDEMGGRLMERLEPALERSIPALEKFATAMLDTVAWASENPGRVITYAIVGSIGKAGLESVLKASLEKALSGGAGATGAIGKLGAVAVVAATAIAAYGATVELIDAKVKAKEDAQKKKEEAAIEKMNAGSDAAGRKRTGTATTEDLAALNARSEELKAERAEIEARVAKGSSSSGFGDTTMGGYMSKASGIFGGAGIAGGALLRMSDIGADTDAQQAQADLKKNEDEQGILKSQIDGMALSITQAILKALSPPPTKVEVTVKVENNNGREEEK